MWQVQKEKYKIYLLFQMSRSLKCFNPTCKCGKIELERVLKIRCKNCHCSIIYDIEQIHLLGAVERAALLAYKQINRDQQNT